MSWNQEEIANVFKEIRKKVVVDKEFRDLFLNNPNEAIFKISGKKVPEGFKIKVIENDPKYNMTFVLPEVISEKLSEQELANVSGGDSIFLVGCVGAGACGMAFGDGKCAADACVQIVAE